MAAHPSSASLKPRLRRRRARPRVATPDAVIVLPRDRAQDVKALRALAKKLD
jgi:hypothetical protein